MSYVRDLVNAAIGISAILYILRIAYVMRGGALARVWFLLALGLLVLMGQDLFVVFSTYGDMQVRHEIASYFISFGLILYVAAFHFAYRTLKPRA
ncbi:hypothetical protein M0Q28_02830 [Patescibacteria group bacterium]|jgi:hypothetical protein|nr:hypothetical protein [Patescibacteria group bacterium]